MKMKKSFVLGCITLMSTTILTACGGNANNSGDSDSDTQVFRMVELQEMPSADLSTATDVVSFTALNNVYEGLYRLNLDNKPEPAGASEKAKISEDGLVYTVKLNEDSKWSDGKSVTAKDYVYGWQRTVDPKTASEYGYMFRSVKNAQDILDGKKDKSELGIKAISDYELEITLDTVTPYFDYLLAFPSFFPQREDIVEKHGKDYASTSENAVYNGPFVLDEFDGPGIDTEWSYKKNDEYWDADTVKLDEIQVSVIKEAPTALNMFENDQIDDVVLTGELAQQKREDPQFVIQKEASTQYLELNQIEADSVFRNENLRKAISYAINREALVSNILGDGSVAAKGLVPTDMVTSPSGEEDFSKASGDNLVYDPEKAKEYLEKAKAELKQDSFTLDILSSDTDSSKKVTEYLQGVIQENLPDVKVTLSPVPFSVRLDRSNKGDFSTVLSGWGADYMDASSFLDLFQSGNAYNRGHYTNETYDRYVKDAATTNANEPEKRWTDLVNAEKEIIDTMGVIPIYQKAEGHLRAEKVKDVGFHPAGSQYDFKWTYIEE